MYSYLTVWEVVPLSGEAGDASTWIVLLQVCGGRVGGIISFGGVPTSVGGEYGDHLCETEGGAHYLQPAPLKDLILLE